MVRDASRRRRKYEVGVDGEAIGRKVAAQKEGMVRVETRYFAQIAQVEAKVKVVCEAAGVPSYQVAQYVNFGRQMWSLSDRFTGATLANEAQRLVDGWVSRGLNGPLLVTIAGFFGVTPTAPAPPGVCLFNVAQIWAAASRTLTGHAWPFTNPGAPVAAGNIQVDGLSQAPAGQKTWPLGSDYTAARAARLDNLDVLLSSRLSKADFDTKLPDARAARIDNLDVLLSSRATVAGVWGAVSRTLTTTQFPFWSALITQQAGTIAVGAGATVFVTIQPPVGETWLIDILWDIEPFATTQLVGYLDWNGAVANRHGRHRFDKISDAGYRYEPCLYVQRLLTNALYGRLEFYSGLATTGYYGYSGFKLSRRHYTLKPVNKPQTPPWKKSTDKKMPKMIEGLQKYAWDLYSYELRDYELSVMCEEDTPYAVDPETDFPVERLTVTVSAAILADLVKDFKKPGGEELELKSGWHPYMEKWRKEGLI